jgi:hypothetical protein
MQELFGSLTRFKRASGGAFEHGSFAIEDLSDKPNENPFDQVVVVDQEVHA